MNFGNKRVLNCSSALRAAPNTSSTFRLQRNGRRTGLIPIRSGMTDAVMKKAPVINVKMVPDELSMNVLLDLEGLDDLPVELDWRFGLSVVIEGI